MYYSKTRFIFFFSFFIFFFATIDVYCAEKTLIVVGEEWAPFEFVKDGKVVGIDIDIASHIFKTMNIPVEFKILPWRRAWSNIKTGFADATLSTSRKEERKPYLWYPKENMWESEYVFFVKKNKMRPNFNGYKTVIQQKLIIGIIFGNSYHPSFWQAFPYKNGATTFQGELTETKLNDQLEGVTTLTSNLKKLANDRIDLYIMDKIIGSYSAKLLNLENQIIYYDKVLYSKGYPMPFAKKSFYPNIKKIADQFEQELKILKQSGEYQRIVDKWL